MDDKGSIPEGEARVLGGGEGRGELILLKRRRDEKGRGEERSKGVSRDGNQTTDRGGQAEGNRRGSGEKLRAGM